MIKKGPGCLKRNESVSFVTASTAHETRRKRKKVGGKGMGGKPRLPSTSTNHLYICKSAGCVYIAIDHILAASRRRSRIPSSYCF